MKTWVQKVRIEYWILGSLLSSIIGFATNYYFDRVSGSGLGITINSKEGVNLLENFFGTKLGWLFFLMILGGFICALLFCFLDRNYSRRARLAYSITVGFSTLLFVILVIWILANEDFVFASQNLMGYSIRGGFGFAFYWWILTLIPSIYVVLSYSNYQGNGEPSLASFIENLNQKQKTQSKTSSKYEKLEKIKDLYDKGILSEEEYLQEKARILDEYQ